MLRCRCVAVRGGVAGDVRDERKEMHLIMVRWIKGIVAVAALVFTNEVAAQERRCRAEFGGGADIVSNYMRAGDSGRQVSVSSLPCRFRRGVLHRCLGVHRFCSRLLPGDGPDACLRGRSGRPVGSPHATWSRRQGKSGMAPAISVSAKGRPTVSKRALGGAFPNRFQSRSHGTRRCSAVRIQCRRQTGFRFLFRDFVSFHLQGHRAGGGYRHGAVECLRRFTVSTATSMCRMSTSMPGEAGVSRGLPDWNSVSLPP